MLGRHSARPWLRRLSCSHGKTPVGEGVNAATEVKRVAWLYTLPVTHWVGVGASRTMSKSTRTLLSTGVETPVMRIGGIPKSVGETVVVPVKRSPRLTARTFSGRNCARIPSSPSTSQTPASIRSIVSEWYTIRENRSASSPSGPSSCARTRWRSSAERPAPTTRIWPTFITSARCGVSVSSSDPSASGASTT